MKPSDLRTRILAAIGAGGLALAPNVGCGGSDSTSVPVDAGGESTSDGANGDGANGDSMADGDASAETKPTEAGAETTPDTAADAADTADVSEVPISPRRPFLVGASLRSSAVAPRDDWATDFCEASVRLDVPTAAALARAYAQDGCEEHASIAAFARFSLQLLALGAPPDLVLHSQRAAIDEIRHAQACFALAHRYGGRSLGPAPLALEGAFEARTLEEIAAITAEEGCVGETLGLLLARHTLDLATDAVVRSFLQRVVDEEARHVDLSWRFVAWAIARGGDSIREAVSGAVRRACRSTRAIPIRDYPGVDLIAWRAHGRATCQDARDVATKGIREVIEPCLAALLAGGRALVSESAS